MLSVNETPSGVPVPKDAQNVFRLFLQVAKIRAGSQALRHRSPFVARRPLAGMKGSMFSSLKTGQVG